MFKKFLLLVLCLLFIVPSSFAADIINFVPADATLVIRANLKQLTAIPEIKAQIDSLMSNEEYVNQIQEAGFDPLRDISSLVVCLPLDKIQNSSKAQTDVAIIAEGNFDSQKIIDSLIASINNSDEVDKKVTVAIENGYNTIFLRNPNKVDIKMMFFDANTMAIGTIEGVSKVKEVILGQQKNIKTNPQFAASIAKVNTNAAFAAVAILPEDARQFIASNDNTKALSNIEILGLDFTKANDVTLSIIGDFKEKTDMKPVEDCLKKFGESLGKDSSLAIMKDIQKNYKVSVEGLSAKVSTTITQDSINKLIENESKPENK